VDLRADTKFIVLYHLKASINQSINQSSKRSNQPTYFLNGLGNRQLLQGPLTQVLKKAVKIQDQGDTIQAKSFVTFVKGMKSSGRLAQKERHPTVKASVQQQDDHTISCSRTEFSTRQNVCAGDENKLAQVEQCDTTRSLICQYSNHK
jgi:hypothetical protein